MCDVLSGMNINNEFLMNECNECALEERMKVL